MKDVRIRGRTSGNTRSQGHSSNIESCMAFVFQPAKHVKGLLPPGSPTKTSLQHSQEAAPNRYNALWFGSFLFHATDWYCGNILNGLVSSNKGDAGWCPARLHRSRASSNTPTGQVLWRMRESRFTWGAIFLLQECSWQRLTRV